MRVATVVYIDIDGTLTHVDNGVLDGHEARIRGVRKLLKKGCEVVLWSGRGAAHCRAFAEKYELEGVDCKTKPHIVVDDNPNLRAVLHINPPEWLEH